MEAHWLRLACQSDIVKFTDDIKGVLDSFNIGFGSHSLGFDVMIDSLLVLSDVSPGLRRIWLGCSLSGHLLAMDMTQLPLGCQCMCAKIVIVLSADDRGVSMP